jgi:uncharacterized protein YqgC (DUF456 family)
MTQSTQQILAYVLMGLGLIGAVVPLLPGPVLILGGAVLWAWADGFVRVGWVPLVIMAVLAIPATASDLIATTVTGRRAGLSWRTLGSALIGGLIGGILFSVLPGLGTLLGAILGTLAGVLLAEYRHSHDWPQAWAAVKAYAVGFLVGRLFELVLCLLMLGVFLWSVFRG